eukprot:3315485-Amphidinium_carterae.1
MSVQVLDTELANHLARRRAKEETPRPIRSAAELLSIVCVASTGWGWKSYATVDTTMFHDTNPEQAGQHVQLPVLVLGAACRCPGIQTAIGAGFPASRSLGQTTSQGGQPLYATLCVLHTHYYPRNKIKNRMQNMWQIACVEDVSKNLGWADASKVCYLLDR